jgi:hypothetical protein
VDNATCGPMIFFWKILFQCISYVDQVAYELALDIHFCKWVQHSLVFLKLQTFAKFSSMIQNNP